MEHLMVQAIISGILLGIIYGLIGMGMNIIYGVMRVVNFAHGEFMMLGAYLSFWLSQMYGINPLQSLSASGGGGPGGTPNLGRGGQEPRRDPPHR